MCSEILSIAPKLRDARRSASVFPSRIKDALTIDSKRLKRIEILTKRSSAPVKHEGSGKFVSISHTLKVPLVTYL